MIRAWWYSGERMKCLWLGLMKAIICHVLGHVPLETFCEAGRHYWICDFCGKHMRGRVDGRD